MKTVLLSIFTLVAVTCGPVVCNNGKAHHWSRWIDEWKTPNSEGYMVQRRYCDDCGLIEVGVH